MSIDEVKSVKHSENLFVQNSINSGELEAVLLQVLLNFSPLSGNILAEVEKIISSNQSNNKEIAQNQTKSSGKKTNK